MSGVSEAALRPSAVLPGLIEVVGAADQEYQTFGDLSISTKGRLALLGYFTSDPANASDPGSYRSHHVQKRQERAQNRLAANAQDAMGNAPDYDEDRQNGTLGLAMALAYTGIRAVRRHGVHVADPRMRKGQVVDGVVTAFTTSYSVADTRIGVLLSTLFQGMHSGFPESHYVKLHNASADWQPPQNPWDSAWVPAEQRYSSNGQLQAAAGQPRSPHPHTVEVTDLNEYQRIITEAMRVLVRNELRVIGVNLPESKVPLDDWLQNETFPPEIVEWLRTIDKTYDMMHRRGFVRADYVDNPSGVNMRPGRRDHIIANDPSATSKAERDGLNGLIHKLKARGGDSRRNREQHPNRHKRYLIEKGVHLRRPRPPKPGEPYYAPAIAQPINVLEQVWIEIVDTWHEVRENPARHVPDILGGVLGKMYGGVSDFVISGSVLLARGAVALYQGVKNHWTDFASWRQQKRQSHSRLGTVLGELRELQTSINEGRTADVFPDVSLPPSRQLELIKRMTTMMLKNLAGDQSGGV